jgi:hypothetical protein
LSEQTKKEEPGMTRSITAVLVALASVSSLAMFQPADPPTGAPVAKAELEEVKEVPAEGSLSGYVTTQSPVIAEAFCIEDYAELAVFKISNSAILSSGTVNGGGDVGDLTWTTLFADEYDWAALDGSHPYTTFIAQRNAIAALVIGELKGTCGVSACISLAFDVDDEGGQRLHYLIPLVKSPQVVHDTALAISGSVGFAQRAVATDPCSGGTPCDDTYRQRLKDAMLAFTQCMKDSTPPISWRNVACFVGCVPLLSGTPLLYAACVAACNGIISGAGVIDAARCANELEAAKENAKASYCACLQYQQQHCPNMAEPENPTVGGCP